MDKNRNENQHGLSFKTPTNGHLDVSTLETWLWNAACAIRGAADAPKFKDFILPLVFYKRLSDVFDDEFAAYIKELGDEKVAHEVIEADHRDALKSGRKPVVRFYIPQKYNWAAIRNHPADDHLGEFITDAMREVARLNPELQGVVDVKDFNERQSGQRTLDDDRLAALIEVLNKYRLGLKDAEPDVLGRAYEYLLRKFAEGQGQSAGEFYTPKEVSWLMANLIDPTPYSTIYDPTCGSGGLLIKSRLLFEQKNPQQKSKGPKLYGQEMNPVTFAMAKMNMFLHDYVDSYFAVGDTFLKPGFAAKGTGLKHFDYVVANPMWNQDNYEESFYANDSYGRFVHGFPPKSSADWGWMQHILASLNDNGRAAVVLDTASASRGSGTNGLTSEKAIRKAFIELDLVECVILLPYNLFYNTDSPGLIYLLNKNKDKKRKQNILFINASQEFIKGRPKNFLSDDGINKIVDVFKMWKEEKNFSKVISINEIVENDYLVSPSKYVLQIQKQRFKPFSDLVQEYKNIQAKEDKVKNEINSLLEKSLKDFDPKNLTATLFGKIPESWSLRPLSDFVSEYNIKAGNKDYEVLSCSKLYGVVLQKEKFNFSVASKTTKNYKVILPDMFVYDPMLLWDGSIGRNNYDFPGVVSPAYSVFEINKDDINIDYLEYILTNDLLLPFYVSVSEGANKRRRKAKFKDFQKIQIPVPPDSIQKSFSTLKIARLMSERKTTLFTDLEQSYLMHFIKEE